MQKISEWLGQFDGHSAICVEKSKADYEEKTGRAWPQHLKGRTASVLLHEGRENFKGLQSWEGDLTDHVIGGWQIAAAVTRELLPTFSTVSIGRGSAFREYVDALRKAGH